MYLGFLVKLIVSNFIIFIIVVRHKFKNLENC